VFFPKTAAWDSLRRALRATHDDAVRAHLAGDNPAQYRVQLRRIRIHLRPFAFICVKSFFPAPRHA
jgi:hypothetical protein